MMTFMTIMAGAEPISLEGSDSGVLLCHGYPSTPQSMRGWAEYLGNAGHTVRVPLLPGMGRTWQDLNRTTWQDWYGELRRAYDELAAQCRTVVVGGLSMGGLLATKLAEDHPEIPGVMLVNPVYTHNNPALPLLPLLRRFVRSLPGPAGDIKKPGVTELAYDRNPLNAMYSQTKLWRIVVEDLPSLTAPVLLLTSREDHVVPAASWRLFLKRVGSHDVTHIVLENSYHVATLDNDAEVIFAESADFVRRVTAAA